MCPSCTSREDDGRHSLLIRRSLIDPNEKAYSFVFAPKGTTLPEMVAAIGARWHIEEDAGKRQRPGAGPRRAFGASSLGIDTSRWCCWLLPTFPGFVQRSVAPPLLLLHLRFPLALPCSRLSVPEVRHLLAQLIWP